MFVDLKSKATLEKLDQPCAQSAKTFPFAGLDLKRAAVAYCRKSEGGCSLQRLVDMVRAAHLKGFLSLSKRDDPALVGLVRGNDEVG